MTARSKSSTLLASHPFLNPLLAPQVVSARAFSTSSRLLYDPTPHGRYRVKRSARTNIGNSRRYPKSEPVETTHRQGNFSISYPSLQAMRKKYDMMGEEWTRYWRRVIHARATNSIYAARAHNVKSQALLRYIERTLGRKNSLPDHEALMQELEEIEEKEREREREKKHNQFMSLYARNVMKLMEDINAKSPTSQPNPVEQDPRLVELQKEKEELRQKKEELMELLQKTETVSETNARLVRLRDALFPKLYVRPESLQYFKVPRTPATQGLGTSKSRDGSRDGSTGDAVSHQEKEQELLDPAIQDTAKHTFRRPLSDNLRLSVPPSGKIYIDTDLTVDFDAEVPDLQSQIFQLQERLRSAYPRIDTLPYEVWSSNNRNTLRTWLKILITRWQTRFDRVKNNGRDIDQGIKQVLDLMVRNHDLSNEAAERMAMRWHDVFNRKRASLVNEENIDWEEYEAGGMGFLIDEEGREKRSSKPQAGWNSSKFAAQGKMTTSSHVNARSRFYSTSTRTPPNPEPATTPNPKPTTTPEQTLDTSPAPTLPHLTPTGSAHMVSVSSKAHTTRTAIAVGTVYFSNPTPLSLIRSNSVKKGDVLSVSRIAGIMAAKKCPDLIPLCHPITLSHVGVELFVFASDHKSGTDMGFGGVHIEAKVECTGATGVEMEALTSVMGSALSVVDMCKAVDKFQRVQDVRVVLKEGGKSGIWREEGWRSWQE